jgi:transcriptional regulator GlxA family with amidase domain
LQRDFPRLKVQENVLFTEKDGIFTSAGVASGIDLTLHILEKEMGAHFAHKVAREIVVYLRRDGSQAQQSVFLSHRNHLHAGIHAVQDWLLENLHHKASLSQLAERANMSTRNFTRIFKKETGTTIGDYLALLRREKIRELLKKPDLSRRQIAEKVGLASERHLSRLAKNA